jgi:hypothetical protein
VKAPTGPALAPVEPASRSAGKLDPAVLSMSPRRRPGAFCFVPQLRNRFPESPPASGERSAPKSGPKCGIPCCFLRGVGLGRSRGGPRKRIILKRRSRRLVCGYVRRNTRLRPVEASQFRPCRPGSRASLAGLISERRPGFPKAIGIESPHPAPGALPLQHGSAYLLTWILPPVPPPGPGRAPPPLETSLTHSEPSPL